jgi:hypothetical protein
VTKQYIQTLDQFAGRDATQKIGRKPEGSGRSKVNMLKVVDKPKQGKVIDPTPYLLKSEDNQVSSWLNAEVARAQAAVTTQTVDLTPTLARVMLGRNPSNRTISEAIVSNYVRDMSSGAWKFNGEPIIVAKDGSLNDGQHRCMAVILSGVPMQAILVIGVERETRTTLDQGRMRTVGDYLSMVGNVDANNLAVAGRLVWQWRKYSLVSGSPIHRSTKGEIMEMIEATPAIAKALNAVTYWNLAAPGSRGMLAFCHYAFGLTAPKEVVERFMHGLTTGENLNGDSPILYVRNRLLAEKTRLKIGERAELIFRAWNAWRRDEHPRTIPLQGGELPMVE